MREYAQLQDKFLVSNFDRRILKHPDIEKLEIEIEQELFDRENIAEDFESKKVRKIKEISIEIEQREEKYKREKDKHIKKKEYSERGLQDLKKDIELFNVRIAQLKSECNIKIRRIDNDIKNDLKKCKELKSP